MQLRLRLYHQALQQRPTSSSSSSPTHLHPWAQQGQANGRGEATCYLVPDTALGCLGISFWCLAAVMRHQCTYTMRHLCMHVW